MKSLNASGIVSDMQIVWMSNVQWALLVISWSSRLNSACRGIYHLVAAKLEVLVLVAVLHAEYMEAIELSQLQFIYLPVCILRQAQIFL